ncbi:hypothetical protein SGRIM128S_08249 [Streptomyces griseomycini]
MRSIGEWRKAVTETHARGRPRRRNSGHVWAAVVWPLALLAVSSRWRYGGSRG